MNQRSNPLASNTSFNPWYEFWVKPKSLHYLENEIMIHPIKGIGHVNFNYHAFLFYLYTWVDGLLNQDDIFS